MDAYHEERIEALASLLSEMGGEFTATEIERNGTGQQFNEAFVAGHQPIAEYDPYLFQALVDTAVTTVIIDDLRLDDDRNWAETDFQRIYLKPGMDEVFGVKVLLHEELHILNHRPTMSYTKYVKNEQEAEVAAFLAASDLGIDSLQGSAVYLKHWDTTPDRVRKLAPKASEMAEKVVRYHVEKGVHRGKRI